MLRTILTVAALGFAFPALAQTGTIRMTEGFARATLPGAPVAGAYVTLENTGSTDDRLVGATTNAAGKVSIHEMEMQGDAMRMQPLTDGLPLPAGATVAMGPSGLHLMLEDLTAPLAKGSSVSMVLEFETSSPLTVEVPVMALNAGSAGHQHQHH